MENLTNYVLLRGVFMPWICLRTTHFVLKHLDLELLSIIVSDRRWQIILLWSETSQWILHAHLGRRETRIVEVRHWRRAACHAAGTNADECLCLRVASERLVVAQECVAHVTRLPALTTEVSKIKECVNYTSRWDAVKSNIPEAGQLATVVRSMLNTANRAVNLKGI